MGFLQPLFLLGLGAAAIPALLHLLQRRVPPTVVFPAVRYLSETERRHSRRLKLRNLLLMLLRMAVIALVVMALARPVADVPIGNVHGPSALAVVVDNSLSSGVVVGGRRLVDRLAEGARGVVGRVESSDRLWLMLADGVPRRVTRLQALAALDSLTPQPVRLDLGEAVRAAARLVGDDPLPGEVFVVSDLQVSALSGAGDVGVPVVVAAPPRLPDNRGVDSVALAPPIWSPDGRLVVSVGGAANAAGEVRAELEGVTAARGLAAPGEQAVLAVATRGPGWYRGRVVVGPDELRGDDERHFAVRAAPPTRARIEPGAGPFVAQAVEVLQRAGRVGTGTDVTVGDGVVGSRGAWVVLPPSEPALIGGVNRALAARGVAWRFGALRAGEWRVSGERSASEGARVFRAHRLEGAGTVIARAGGEPWIVRDGDVVLVGSRLEEAWTSLPVTADFVPFVDALVNRIAGREAVRVPVVPGAAVRLPSGTAAYAGPSGRVPVTGGLEVQAPASSGAYYLLDAAGDTIGALEVNHDARESVVRQADEDALRAAFGRVDLVPSDAAPDAVFRSARRADLSGWALGLALLLALVEFGVSSLGGRRAEGA